MESDLLTPNDVALVKSQPFPPPLLLKMLDPCQF